VKNLRKTFATTVDDNLQEEFRQSCKEKNLKINDVLEALMKSFIDGTVDVEVKKIYMVKSTDIGNKK